MNLERQASETAQQFMDRNIVYSVIKIAKVNKHKNKGVYSIPDKIFLVPNEAENH